MDLSDPEQIFFYALQIFCQSNDIGSLLCFPPAFPGTHLAF